MLDERLARANQRPEHHVELPAKACPLAVRSGRS
jgi:hypothetical protein